MRNTIRALCVAAAVLGLANTAQAANPQDAQPEVRAFVHVAFGGNSAVDNGLLYGLRIDQDSRFENRSRQPIMSVEFNRSGFAAARVNGVPFAQTLRLNQYDDGQPQTQWTWVDWGLLAVGVGGLGYVIAEVASSNNETPDP